MSHSVTGIVKSIEACEGGWGKNASILGVNVSVQISIPYVRLTDDGQGTNDVKYETTKLFFPPTEQLPLIGDEVTVTLAPSDENVSIN